MDILLNILIAVGFLPANDLTDSMKRSKTLTIMVIVGLVLFASFILFLLYMASKL